MKSLRFWNALAWGVVAFWFALEGFWAFTQMELLEIIFLAVMALLFVFGVVAVITEPKKENPEPKPLNPADCPIITLNKEDWKYGE